MSSEGRTNGDDAFRHELVSHRTALLAYAMKLTGNRAQAEDLTQNTMEKALLNQHRFVPGSNMRGWLKTIMKNRFLDEKRREKHRRKATLAYMDIQTTAPAEQERNVDARKAVDAMSQLSKKKRDAVKVVHMDGDVVADTARRERTPRGTYSSRANRGVKILRKILLLD